MEKEEKIEKKKKNDWRYLIQNDKNVCVSVEFLIGNEPNKQ